MKTQRRMSVGWYGLAVVVAVAGLVAGVSWALMGYFDVRDEIAVFSRVAVPGEGTIALVEPGDYVVYYESPTAADTRVPDVGVSLFLDGQRLQTGRYGTELVYDVPDAAHTGRALATFTAPDAGQLRLVTRGAAGASIAIGDSFAAPLTARVVAGVLIAFAALLAAIAIGVVTYLRRSREDHAVAPPVRPAGAHRELIGR